MAKYRTRSRRQRSRRSKRRRLRLRFVVPSRVRKLLRPATSFLVVAATIAAAYLVLPEQLRWQWHLLLGLAWAAMAVVIFAGATRPTEFSEEEMLYRIRRGQHADFGKRLRKAQEKRTTIRMPVVGETSYRVLGGVAVFVAMGAWWLGPLAPVAPVVPKVEVVEDMTTLFAEEIVAVVLVTPDGNLAIVQPPILPPRVRSLAWEIESEAVAYERGLRAMAWSRFEEARKLFAAAIDHDDAPRYAVQVALAQNEMYAGEFSDAARWYAKALQEEPDDPMLLCQMAVAWMQAGAFGSDLQRHTQQLLARAMEICREKPADEEGQRALAACLHVQAVSYACLGRDYDEAVRMCSRTRNLLKDAPRRQHPFEAASLNNQGVLYLLQAKYPGAEGLNRRAGDIWARTLGPHHPHVAASRGNLAMVQYVLGRHTQAMELLARSLASRSRNLPEIHPILGLACNANAVLHLARGEYQQARPLAEKALMVFEATLGPGRALTVSEEAPAPEHPAMAAVLDTLGNLYIQRAQYAQAESFYERALAIAEKAWGPKHPYLAVLLNDLAGLHIAQGRCGKAEAYQKAEAACQRALDIARQAFGDEHPRVATVLYTCGQLEIERGRPRDARGPLEEALKIRKAAFGTEHPDLARTSALLASLENGPRTYARAVTQYERVIATTEKLLGRKHPDVARMWCGLAVLHADRGKYSKAARCLQQALAIQEQALVPYHPDLARTLELYAALLRKSDPPEPDRAAEMEYRAGSIREEHAEEDRPE